MADLPPSWRDHEDRPTSAPSPPTADEEPFYRPIGDFQGADYGRNAFARGTEGEVEVLVELLGLAPGARVLDVGCGDGRHLRAMDRRGIGGVGVDISPALVAAARAAAAEQTLAGVSFVVADARHLALDAPPFDAAMSLCHGGFGTSPDTDGEVVARLAAHVRPGGRVAFTAFHALFAARHLAPGDAFDAMHLVHHHEAEVHGPEGARRRFSLWTAAYTAREAVSLAEDCGLDVTHVRGVQPGAYDGGPLGLDDPEMLVVARKR